MALDLKQLMENSRLMYEFVVRTDVEFLRAHPSTPRFIDSGVRVATLADDLLEDIPCMLGQKFGQLGSVACWRAAELCLLGVEARVELVPLSVGFGLAVRWSEGFALIVGDKS